MSMRTVPVQTGSGVGMPTLQAIKF
ncbi:hypothetical protein ACHAXR_007235 [Thalassiosira sp. AJA248-18]